MSRIAVLKSGRSRTSALAADIRRAAGSTSRKQVGHVRLLPDGHVLAYDWRPDRVYLSAAQEQAVTQVMHATRPDIDWTIGHDYHLVTGMLRRSPEVGERGYTPEVEGHFGGADPVFLPRPADSRSAA